MITRRQALLAILIAPASRYHLPYQEPQEPQPPINNNKEAPFTFTGGSNTGTFEPAIIQKPWLELTLWADSVPDGIDKIVVNYGKERLEISAKDIWDAIQSPAVYPPLGTPPFNPSKF